MRFSETYPDYASVEEHVRRARAERAVYLASEITRFIVAASSGLKRVVASTARSMEAERERRAIEADPFLKRSVPRY
jgi:hypothetical protein